MFDMLELVSCTKDCMLHERTVHDTTRDQCLDKRDEDVFAEHGGAWILTRSIKHDSYLQRVIGIVRTSSIDTEDNTARPEQSDRSIHYDPKTSPDVRENDKTSIHREERKKKRRTCI